MRIDTTVRDVMHREFLGVSESDPLADAAALLVEEGTDCLVVLRGGEAVGRLAARDALAAVLEDDADDATVGSVMRPPLPTVAPDDGLRAVEERLVAEGVDRVVVAADGEAVGVVTARDSLAAGAAREEDPPEEPTAAADVRNGARLETTRSGTADAARGSERARTASSTDAGGVPTQGVCEVCGALVPDLADANGQAICPNCREV
ncbi:CBS domain-containing protein [Halorubrum halodurans]|uniref:CBS domain-containing protein n=1 Tax=Halorubrum halodurans TaxID=1383851 RepID=A0A256IRR5_9EURY|nr:CBS domain-containing protein [Halorubrum halodurans]OYR59259.1 CBS domain-containing protein [Halorubrum halodurans]